MTNQLKAIGWCSLAILIALYIVGAVSHGSLRHEVQTLPLWVSIVAGFSRREIARWCAAPCFLFWFVCMALIWLFLLGWSHVISGHFSLIEIAMTIVIGAGGALGIMLSLRRARWSIAGAGVSVAFAVFQLAAFHVSMLPGIANH
jgi:hypothetical protein